MDSHFSRISNALDLDGYGNCSYGSFWIIRPRSSDILALVLILLAFSWSAAMIPFSSGSFPRFAGFADFISRKTQRLSISTFCQD